MINEKLRQQEELFLHQVVRGREDKRAQVNQFDNLIQFGQIHFVIWTNKFYNLDKYILVFEKIHFTIWTNTFLIFGQIHFTIWTDTFLIRGQIHFTIWTKTYAFSTNTFCNLNRKVVCRRTKGRR